MDINLDEQKAILFVKPTSAFKAEDFARLSQVFDGYVAQHGSLKGLMIETDKFPGWEDLDAFKAHVIFIKDHHDKVNKIALITDSNFAYIAKAIGAIVATQIQQFPSGQMEQARQWIEE